MSAAMVILPQVWAMAARPLESRRFESRPLEATAARLTQQRKGPHRLVLVQASGSGPQVQQQRRSHARPLVKPAPELAFYRKYTEAMLRRYMKMAMEAGRVPSLLGREIFQGNVNHSRITSFEDVVIFVLDVERCVEKLSPGQQHLVRRIALQEYTQGETSAMLGISLRTVVRRYAEALDALTQMMLQKGMLQSLQRSPAEDLVQPTPQAPVEILVKPLGLASSL